MLASAKTTRDPALSPVRAGWFAFPLAPALRSTDSAAVTESGCALFAGFPATMTGLDFPRPYIIGYSSSLSRHRPPASSADGQTWDLPASDAIRLHVNGPISMRSNHRVSSHGTRCFADATIFGELGVVRLRKFQGRRP